MIHVKSWLSFLLVYGNWGKVGWLNFLVFSNLCKPSFSIIMSTVNIFMIFTRDEGIVLKDYGSKWDPGDRSGKWLKLKPDYIHAGSDLDVLIIGGWYFISNLYDLDIERSFFYIFGEDCGSTDFFDFLCRWLLWFWTTRGWGEPLMQLLRFILTIYCAVYHIWKMERLCLFT